MFVGIGKVTLSIPESGSLKDKRQIVRKVLDRTRAKFNVAAAEVDANDLWQKAELGFAVVGNDRRFVEESLNAVLHFVEEMYVAPVVDRRSEVMSVGLGGAYEGNRTLAEAEAGVDPDWDPADDYDDEEESP